MVKERSFETILIYLIISVILPIALILINHIFWIDNIMLTVIIIGWMGFALLALQPYSIGEYETVEP